MLSFHEPSKNKTRLKTFAPRKTFVTPFATPPLRSSPLLSATQPVTAGGMAAASATGGTGTFQNALSAAMPAAHQVQVQSGDTLIGLVKAHFRQNQQALSEGQATRLAHDIASRNQIDNPDLIWPGQTIDFSALKMPPLARSAPAGPQDLSPQSAQALRLLPGSTAQALAHRPVGDMAATGAHITAHLGATDTAPLRAREHPLLDRTLARAANKGYLPAQELAPVRERILSLAQRYNFQPDDFARLTLMESGGMNPQASNGNCHGIIQFCDGPNRGAASVGFKNNPRDILGVGLLQQLDLVDRYFSQAGLPVNGPPVGLDDLYLTVLTPAARRETRPDAPLPIAGPQARYLHVGHNTQAPITRNSILAGLYQLSDALLGPTPSRQAAVRHYADVAHSSPNH